MLSLAFLAIAVVALVATSLVPRFNRSRVAAVLPPLGLFLLLQGSLLSMALGSGLLAFGLREARRQWIDLDEELMQARADEYARRLARAR